ncbi:hypothetical protein A3H10_00685 [Candidatus Uhrbacteria bacterium RIFCSPLOWO2_12_FULL_46_10]|uniref:Histidine kinase N-terminal 7TM region domain-containing protein n=1 Tax=Candidatus Uhrbacteria bacterium RIFCSPLOWO2_01_FULL_47_25 TaxID=1802402 RepID=A0A1F7UV36_9BACT|nr:MAG: hypothetical protein A2752_02135 [Candidatus Uhrbacteria bacterium RIFCSPHIGHO2_01_FULL_46_23]OGL69962.1 MAG: hypothetical protein A3D60_02315 [Candidatus Uhrbacteria bacterium RIFCSPHIGHO2_02_FULL_47_29]OGL76467.1 MAG: hypothetical protein A3E96_00760 [Candidatus Uhrbacteria bacterium RIFCSPHIGHO2_12_FULL_46_13]OGL82125.1 MAG: hypothetical protein A2936_01010 [Candidatus Uhrbacteria bacterium RIFCSPLOWO2_01_FULL_47_25]OGL85721.1 MAG: hypothetical protein A3I37_01110 [Candidatus Uhrbact
MKSYSWFWFFTAIAWILISIKYSLIGFGYLGSWLHYVDLLLQSAIFSSGLPLIYYVGLKFFDDKRLADILGLATIMPIVVAIWLIIQPGGLVLRDLTFFSAKSFLNSGSLIIFNVEVAIIIAILIYDIATWLYRWRQSRDQNALIESLYSIAIITYLVLGSIEQSGLIKNWTVIIFRIMYAAAFLFVYLLITQREIANENYLIEEGNTINGE